MFDFFDGDNQITCDSVSGRIVSFVRYLELHAIDYTSGDFD
jgi:hypothetical protein